MFSTDDFANEEITSKLSVIIMTKLGQPPLSNFHKLMEKEKKKFNKDLNTYIKNLPNEDWLAKLTNEYNEICSEDIFNEKFNSLDFEPMDINTEVKLLE